MQGYFKETDAETNELVERTISFDEDAARRSMPSVIASVRLPLLLADRITVGARYCDAGGVPRTAPVKPPLGRCSPSAALASAERAVRHTD